MNVETELQEAVSVKRKRNEEEADYIERLATKAIESEDKVWTALSEKAQNWVNSVIEAVDNKEDLPALPEDDELDEEQLEEEVVAAVELVEEEEEPEAEEEEESEPEPEEDEEEVVQEVHTQVRRGRPPAKVVAREVHKAPEPPVRRGRPPTKVVAREVHKEKVIAKTTKTNSTSRKRGSSPKEMVRQLVAKNPSITKDQLIQKIKDAGYELRDSSIIQWRYSVLQIMRTLSHLGLLKTSMK